MKCHKCDMHMENVYIFNGSVSGSCDCTDTPTHVFFNVPDTWGIKQEDPISIGVLTGDMIDFE